MAPESGAMWRAGTKWQQNDAVQGHQHCSLSYTQLQIEITEISHFFHNSPDPKLSIFRIHTGMQFRNLRAGRENLANDMLIMCAHRKKIG